MLALFAAALGAGQLTANAAPADVSGDGGGVAVVTVSTNSSTVSVSGGTPPYTYAWSRQSGSTQINATNPSSASTLFRRVNQPIGASESAIFICTVTDSAARTAQTNTVTASISNLG